jgi:bifunctional DNA-binding transcriptional regulator/antitoxin component of YhaV-PrlF toxin-antitoxin module
MLTMTVLKVTAKGQITLRKDVLRHLGVEAGAKVAAHKLPNGRIELKAAAPAAKISEVFGMLRRDGRAPVSVEEMNEIAAKGWAGEA